MIKRKIEYENFIVEYILVYKNVKNINIRIKDGMVYISSNRKIPLDYIESILKSKWDWIKDKLNHSPTKFLINNYIKYEDGELFPYLGNFYKLEIVKGSFDKVELNDNLEVSSKKSDDKYIKKLLDNWYNEKISFVFYDSFNRNYSLVKNYTHVIPTIKFRKMKASWGNCRMPSGIITLNKNLIATPLEFIDYVMVHELVHLVHPNHSKDFYNLLDVILPNWKDLKNLLHY